MFAEVSAKTGEGVDDIFMSLGKRNQASDLTYEYGLKICRRSTINE